MGNQLKSRYLDPVFKEWFLNYNSDQTSVGFIGNNIHLENLVLDCNKINEILKAKNIPLELKFGLLSELNIKISYLNLNLE